MISEQGQTNQAHKTIHFKEQVRSLKAGTEMLAHRWKNTSLRGSLYVIIKHLSGAL